MTKEVCGICTGSYTGEFDPKWRGPWAKYFDAQGRWLEYDNDADQATRGKQLVARGARFKELRERGRAPSLA
jgi:hypothetical protein